MKWTEDDEKQAGDLVPGETYPFEVVESEEKTSKKGNPYINIKMRVFVEDMERTLYDILMPQMPAKLRAFCEATGLVAEYESRSLGAHMCVGRQAYVRLSKKKNDQGYVQVEAYAATFERPEAKKQEPMVSGVTRQQTQVMQDDPDIPF